jgi:hypothetical protein
MSSAGRMVESRSDDPGRDPEAAGSRRSLARKFDVGRPSCRLMSSSQSRRHPGRTPNGTRACRKACAKGERTFGHVGSCRSAFRPAPPLLLERRGSGVSGEPGAFAPMRAFPFDDFTHESIDDRGARTRLSHLGSASREVGDPLEARPEAGRGLVIAPSISADPADDSRTADGDAHLRPEIPPVRPTRGHIDTRLLQTARRTGEAAGVGARLDPGSPGSRRRERHATNAERRMPRGEC